MKNLKNIKLTNTHKIIIGVAGLGILLFLTKKYWMPKKKQEEISKQSIPSEIPSVSSTENKSMSRDMLISELTKSSNTVGGMSLSLTPELFKDFTDKELEILLKISKMQIDKIQSDKEAESLMSKNNISKQDFGLVLTKLGNAFKKVMQPATQPKPKSEIDARMDYKKKKQEMLNSKYTKVDLRRVQAFQ